jgi:hypothetical protein
MIEYHAVLLDETNCEMGVTIKAEDRAAAIAVLAECYPECRCVQLEDDNDAREREEAMYRRIAMEDDGYFYEDEMDRY